MYSRSIGVILRPSIQRLSDFMPNVESFQSVPQCFVRYSKRRWSPLTPSKLFVVKERHKQDLRESDELRTLYKHYRTSMRAIRLHLQDELSAKEAELHDKSHVDEEKQHLVWCLAENNKFNVLSAQHRNERQLIEQKEKEHKELRKLLNLESQRRETQQKALQKVLAAQKEAQHFITQQVLDTVIEASLNTRSVFNFAIDLEGNHYVEQLDGNTVVVSRASET